MVDRSTLVNLIDDIPPAGTGCPNWVINRVLDFAEAADLPEDQRTAQALGQRRDAILSMLPPEFRRQYRTMADLNGNGEVSSRELTSLFIAAAQQLPPEARAIGADLNASGVAMTGLNAQDVRDASCTLFNERVRGAQGTRGSAPTCPT